MAKARAIVKRRKAVRNIRKITKTMQMIATAKFQKSLKRAVGTKPYTLKVRELVRELARSVGDVDHPLLRRPEITGKSNRIAVVVITSNRGLAGAYNGSVLRTAMTFIKRQEKEGNTVDSYVVGKKGISFFNFQKRPMVLKALAQDTPTYDYVRTVGETLIPQFIDGRLDAVYVAYMNFISTGTQRPEVTQLLPFASIEAGSDQVLQQIAEKEAQMKAGMLDAKRSGAGATIEAHVADHTAAVYEFSPDAKTLLDELLPLTLKTAFYQTFLDATTSEHVGRMVAMKAATDNAEQMVKSLTMQYNRARQSQITTELAEIMGGVEAMKG